MSVVTNFLLLLAIFLIGIGCFRYMKKQLKSIFENRFSGFKFYVTQGFVTTVSEIIFFIVPPLTFLSFMSGSITDAIIVMRFNIISLPWLLTGIVCGVVLSVYTYMTTIRFGKGVYNFAKEMKSWNKRDVRIYFFIFIFQSLLYSLPEEVLFRGFLQSQFSILFGDMLSLLLATVIFSIHPHTNMSMPEVLLAFPVSLLLCLLFSLSGSLIVPLVSHWLTNFLCVFLAFKKVKPW